MLNSLSTQAVLRRSLALLLSISLIGCTTMKAVDRPTPSTPKQVVVGDDVRVTTKVGKTYELEITAVTDSSMTGREEGGKLWKVPFNQIETLEVEKISAAKTAGLSVASVIALAAIGMLIFGYALSNALEDATSDDH